MPDTEFNEGGILNENSMYAIPLCCNIFQQTRRFFSYSFHLEKCGKFYLLPPCHFLMKPTSVFSL